jgi:hypothetical protein
MYQMASRLRNHVIPCWRMCGARKCVFAAEPLGWRASRAQRNGVNIDSILEQQSGNSHCTHPRSPRACSIPMLW